MLILILSLSGIAQYYNFDNFFKVNQKLLTKDFEATGTVTMDTLGTIIDYADSLLDAKVDTTTAFFVLDSIQVADEKITEIGTSTADTLIIKIGGVEWYLLKRP